MIPNSLKVFFFGSSFYSLPVLEVLYRNFQLSAIVTKPDSAPLKFAQNHDVQFLTPIDKNGLRTLKDQVTRLKPDLFVVADFGMIIPPEIFNIPKFKTLNIHFSKLPDLRGASPVQFTLLRGDKAAWISIIIMDEGLDTGSILWQKEIALGENYAAGDLYQKLFNLVSSDLPDVINKYINKEIKPFKQNNLKATYTRILTRSDGFIPWKILKFSLEGKKLSEAQFSIWPLYKYFSSQFSIVNFQLSIFIERASRALSPWPGLWTEISVHGKPQRLKLLKLRLEDNKIVLDLVQLEGKKPVSGKQFQEGYPQLLS